MARAKKTMIPNNILAEMTPSMTFEPTEDGLRKALYSIIPNAVEYAKCGKSGYASFLIKFAEKALPEFRINAPSKNISPEEYSKMLEPLFNRGENNENECKINEASIDAIDK